MKILIISDAWYPQVNGVVRTLETTLRELEKLGHEVKIVGPDTARRATFATPSYRDIRLEFFGGGRLGRAVDEFQPDFIHVATEGPLGWAARSLCLQRQLPFTTSYHTRFPEYVAARMPRFLMRGARILTYALLRRFHAPSSAIMVPTRSLMIELRARKFRHLAQWPRGVNTRLFRPCGKDVGIYENLPRPILLYVGRVAVEKNLRAFLDLNTSGSKIVIGEGPDLARLRADYPAAHFPGLIEGEELVRYYSAADLFVFPSRTDTFGLVLLEAAACGLRIASVRAPGPVDIFTGEAARAFAVLDDDLGRAVEQALQLSDDPALPCRFAEAFSWAVCTRQFYNHLQAPTPEAVKRIVRVRVWLQRWWRHALALAFK